MTSSIYETSEKWNSRDLSAAGLSAAAASFRSLSASCCISIRAIAGVLTALVRPEEGPPTPARAACPWTLLLGGLLQQLHDQILLLTTLQEEMIDVNAEFVTGHTEFLGILGYYFRQYKIKIKNVPSSHLLCVWIAPLPPSLFCSSCCLPLLFSPLALLLPPHASPWVQRLASLAGA